MYMDVEGIDALDLLVWPNFCIAFRDEYEGEPYAWPTKQFKTIHIDDPGYDVVKEWACYSFGEPPSQEVRSILSDLFNS